MKAKSEALNRKKEETETSNLCKKCEGKHKTKDHKEDKVENENEE